MKLVTGHVQASSESLADRDDPRSVALWQEAVGQLERFGLIEDQSGSGEVFEVTAEGYRVADQIAAEKQQ